MIHSVRQKLFIWISLLIAFFVLFSWVLNTNYLERYYLFHKSTQLRNNAQQIETLITNPPEDLYLQMETLEDYENINILILNSSYELIYATLSYRGPNIRINMVLDRLQDLTETNYVETITTDPVSNMKLLDISRRLNNGYYLIMSTPLASLEASADIANTFFLYTGLATLLLATLIIFAFSRRFTRPILELNDIAQRMARLDFSKTYPVTTKDELGELGQSINSMSAQLSQSINELQEANARLKEDIKKERQIDEMRKEFISNVSHELKTPIALIQGYAEGLKVNVVQDEGEKDFYCSVIMDEANKMNKLVKELLDLSQMEAGIFRLEKSPFDLSSLLDRVIAKYKPIFEEKQVKLEVDKAEVIPVNADIIRTEQILTNYINNALNHLNEQKQLKLTVQTREDKVRISLFNSGELIPEDALSKIFTSFYKVNQARTRTDGGTGLGLSVVKAIQGKDNNLYGAENLEGGVSFWFELDLV
ncbi:MAG: HAMP domain-containing histidine kinase [Syntrophomonadaceae bacterium]|jgi:signal transduction histidine kinase|nr:HAMP domain-containing histidine kinase [Syntrophomonadaceae bacterium]